MARKKRKEEHVNHERWLISYADFITLLFAFFVVMFASAQVDHRKVGKLAMAIQAAFTQLGVFQTSNSRMPLDKMDPMPFENIKVVDNALRGGDLPKITNPMSGVISNADAAIRAVLEKTLAKEIAKKTVGIHQTREGLVISLRELGFFDSGSIALKPGSQEVLRQIAEVLSKTDEPIRIEGHTDNVPIHKLNFPSNWELSTARATEIVRMFITDYNFDPTRLQAAGYAQYHPVASNATAEGRALNRRVDIVVLSADQPLQEPESSGTKEAPPAAGPAARVKPSASFVPSLPRVVNR